MSTKAKRARVYAEAVLACSADRRRRWWPARVLFVGMLGAVGAGVAGCVNAGPPPKPTPTPIPAQPRTLAPTLIVFAISPFLLDTDRNGYADTIEATVFLFAEGYVYPIEYPGTFTFVLVNQENKVVARWVRPPAEAAKALGRTGPGPAYRFLLNILDVTSDQMESQRGEISVRFEPEDGGTPIQPRGGTALQIGRLR